MKLIIFILFLFVISCTKKEIESDQFKISTLINWNIYTPDQLLEFANKNASYALKEQLHKIAKNEDLLVCIYRGNLSDSLFINYVPNIIISTLSDSSMGNATARSILKTIIEESKDLNVNFSNVTIKDSVNGLKASSTEITMVNPVQKGLTIDTLKNLVFIIDNKNSTKHFMIVGSSLKKDYQKNKAELEEIIRSFRF